MKRVVKHLGILSALLAYGCTSGPETTKSEVKPAAASGDATVGTVSTITSGISLDAIGLVEVDEDGSKSIPLKISTTTAGSIRIAIISYPSHGDVIVDEAAKSVRYTPDRNYNGRDSFAVSVLDGTGASTAGVASIIVKPIDDAPVCLSQSFGAKTALEIRSKIVCDDVDSTNLAYTINTRPQKGSLTLANSEFIYILAAGQTSDDQFEVIAKADGKESAPAVIKILPGTVGEKPVAVSRSLSCTEDQSCSAILGAESSIPNQGYHFELTKVSSGLTADLNIVTGEVTIQPAENFFGAGSIMYKARSGDKWSDEAKIDILVAPLNDIPNISLQEGVKSLASIDEDSTLKLGYVVSDVESAQGDLEARIDEAAQPANGVARLALEEGRIYYEPKENFNGSDSFQVIVCEKNTNPEICSVPLLISVEIKAVNDAPFANPLTLAVTEDGQQVCENLSSFYGDVDNDLSTLQVTLDALKGMTLENNQLCFTPAPNDDTQKTLQYRVVDAENLEASSSITIDIGGVEDSTIFDQNSLSCEIFEEKEGTCTVQATDADGPVSYELMSKPESSWKLDTSEFQSTGSFKILSPADFVGPLDLKIKAHGAGASSATDTLRINVINTYDPPTWIKWPGAITTVSLSLQTTLEFQAVTNEADLKISYPSVELSQSSSCTMNKVVNDQAALFVTVKCPTAPLSLNYKVTATDGKQPIKVEGTVNFIGSIGPYEIGAYWTSLGNGTFQETSSNAGLKEGYLSCLKLKAPLGATKVTFYYDIALSSGYLDTYQNGALKYPYFSGKYSGNASVPLNIVDQSNDKVDICHFVAPGYLLRKPEIIVKDIKFQ